MGRHILMQWVLGTPGGMAGVGANVFRGRDRRVVSELETQRESVCACIYVPPVRLRTLNEMSRRINKI